MCHVVSWSAGRSAPSLTLSNLEIVLFLKVLSPAPRLGAMLSAAISVAATAIADTARRILVQMLTSVRSITSSQGLKRPPSLLISSLNAQPLKKKKPNPPGQRKPVYCMLLAYAGIRTLRACFIYKVSLRDRVGSGHASGSGNGMVPERAWYHPPLVPPSLCWRPAPLFYRRL